MPGHRIVRTFKFDRILTFVLFVCFAVALVCVMLSVSVSPARLKVKPRTFYIVTYARSETKSEAQLKSEECFSRSGAGNIVPDGDTFYIAAAVYTERKAAESVATREGFGITEVTFGGLSATDTEYSETLADALVFCAVTLPDTLEQTAAELDERTSSQAVAVDRCSKCADSALVFLRRTAAAAVATAASEDEKNALSAASNMLGVIADVLRTVAEGEGDVTTLIRRAFVSCVLALRDASKDLK